MAAPQPIGKQLRVAAYSSPAVSALTVTPLFILNNVPFEWYPWAFGLATLLVFLFWAVNIGLYRLVSGQRRGRDRMRYSLSYVFCILFTFFLFHTIFQGHFGSSRGGLHFHVIVFFAVDTVILILQDLVVTREKNVRIELENSRLRIRDMEAVNLRLSQQVHPHFLFNSLSTLKALIAVSPEQATEYLIRLSGFLRSSMTDKGVVPVAKELEWCSDYLAMQQIRFGEALRYSIEVPVEIRGAFFLPVFSVQLLIENAIKHNVLTPDRPLSIRIVCQDGMIIVENNLQRKGGMPDGTASGLNNLRERYQALGGDPVRVEETAERFSVSIKALQHESGDH
jgi:sensor histidine kinase YesM